ncbi:MAG: GHMP kinase [Bacteroidetes bacterium]|nr:GHMP kinase [Bacteroidota bacterium]
MISRKNIIVTRTPLRMSFAGGGTDLPAFYQKDYGAVLSMAINKYIYVTVKRHGEIFNEPVRLNYSKTELVINIDEIENDIVRASLRFLEIELPLYISTIADLPASTGLGGSSSFAVGLLNALHAYRGERVSAGQLAEEASYIEMDVLKQPIGKQDQYAAAFGGFNLFRFESDGTVTVDPLHMSNGMLQTFLDHVLVFWTGIRRDASSVLTKQKENTPQKMANLQSMRSHAHQLRELISNGHFDTLEFGRILDETWQLKRTLADTISNIEIDQWYGHAIESGATGGKICGAGGGGFLLFVAPRERHNGIRKALGGLTEIEVGLEVHGSEILIS